MYPVDGIALAIVAATALFLYRLMRERFQTAQAGVATAKYDSP